MKLEKLQTTSIICRGGLDSNENWLFINNTNIGIATELVNFEPSLYGGYRRINGFTILEETDSGEVDPTGAEGKIYGVFIYNNQILAARKQQSGATYEFYKYNPSSSWSKYSTGLTFTSSDVNRVRYETFNVDGVEKIIFVDGVNKATLFDNTNWIDIDPSATGANYANAGGTQALSTPLFVKSFKRHIFMADSNLIAYSAPDKEYDWTSASGAGQLNAGMTIKQIFPFRDELYVFGERKIKKIVVDSSGVFVLQNVTEDIGCVASDSVIEINGDLLFLSQDGVRPISATERINDIEMATISKAIQRDIYDLLSEYSGNDIMAVTVSSKSQFRMFFTPSSVSENIAPGIIGAIKNYDGSPTWEFARLMGIKVSCVTQGRYGPAVKEYVLHGTYDGKVMRQEFGNSFNGNNIVSIFSTPYIDFQMPMVRKTPQEIMTFIRAEGESEFAISLKYDWGLTSHINPSNYTEVIENIGFFYGSAIWGTATFGGNKYSITITNIEGSGKSMRFSFVCNNTTAPFSIQGLTIKYRIEGYK